MKTWNPYKNVGIFLLILVSVVILVSCYKQTAEKPGEETKVKIESLQPDRGTQGSTVVISGSGFSADANELAVTFGPARATIKDAGNKVLVVEVPKNLTQGNYEVSVTNTKLNSTSAPKPFTVTEASQVSEAGPAVDKSRPAAGTTRQPRGEVGSTSAREGASITVPEGTTLVVRSVDAISTKTNKAGDQIEFTLDRPLIVRGQLVAPKLSRVIGRITNAKEPGHVKGRAQLSFRLVELTPTGGTPRRITTNAFSSEAASTTKRDALIIGSGAGIGTAIGAIAGGKKGAAIGAAAGGAGGLGTVVAMRGKQLEIPPETMFRFRLREPVTLASRGPARERETTEESGSRQRVDENR